ncbi:MAG: DUF4230 domain-containing protein [Bacteroidales bacterium]|nr:DUF4230 domain-containing protein [Bacteroidales bacterium]
MKEQAKQYKTLILIACVAAVAAVAWFVHSLSQSEVSVGVDDRINITPEQIESIKAIGQWEFLSIADEDMVDTTRKGFFSDDHLVRIYYGTVRLGIDMNDVQPDWLQVEGDSILVQLPAIGLLDDNFIDEARTKSFHESGRWKGADREALYHKARQRMLDHCLTKKNLKTARQNGDAQFRNMMRAMGYNHVVIRWDQE